ncbi:MAG: acetylxylan esterase [Verrucomicrobiaceae bacterium]|nr:MAG: acetylxylan esterase [Verrucomicrobiaceae bacterium]
MAAPLTAGEIPDPLTPADGKVAANAQDWREHVRPGTLQMFRENVYGKRPVAKPDDFAAKVTRLDAKALDGAATLREIEITYSGPGGKGRIRPVVLTPNAADKPVPAFLLINFRKPDPDEPRNRGGEWPVREIIARGYAAVAFDFNDVDPDRPDGFNAGVRAIFGKQPPPADAWGALSAWGWGASRVLDWLETDTAIDAKHVAITGHSRAGKAALWAGVEDERFALVITNNSGCGGAALARGKQGERVANITTKFPYWFCGNYAKYADKEDELPVDHHQLIGAIAPRRVYVTSATLDTWADPVAEFKACVLAGPVFRLHGLTGLESDTTPPPDQPMAGGHIGYHVRTGKHDLTLSDWKSFMDYTDRHWK